MVRRGAIQCARCLAIAAFSYSAPHAWAADSTARPATGLSPAVAQSVVYLNVVINGESRNQIARFSVAGDRLFVRPEDLSTLGLDVAAMGLSGTGETALDAVRGLRYRYDTGRQEVAMQVETTLLRPFAMDSRGVAPPPPATSSRGLVLNYDAYAQSRRENLLALYTEARYFNPSGVFSNTGIGYLYRDFRRYVRYDSYWATSNQDTLETTQYGDAISSSLNWSRSVRFGGLQWRKNFALRPDLVTFPIPSLGGTAVVPSAVDVYVNNIRQFSGAVPTGPFVLNNISGITGAGQANIVTRDALGRPVSTTLPIYIDSRLMAAGLSSYSAEAGFLRRNYGLRSFDYESKPAASGSYRYGVDDALTIEGHGEATPGVYNLGAGALLRLGTMGVINTSLSASAGRFGGSQIGVGYQYIDPGFSIDLQTLRTVGDYGDLASNDDIPVPAVNRRATVAVPFGRSQTVALSYIGLSYPGESVSHVGSATYNVAINNRVNLNLNAFKDFSRDRSTGVLLGISMSFGDGTSGTVTAGRQNGEATYTASAQRAPDYGGGWGWGAQAGAGSFDYSQGWAQYLGRYGRITAGAQQYDGRAEATLSANGAIVLMDGELQASRQVYDSFALVSTDGQPDVQVLSQHREIGRTNSRGYLLVPDLNSYQRNTIGIKPVDLSADMRIETDAIEVVPQSQSGVLARFGVKRFLAASVHIQGPDGHDMPVGTRVRHVESGAETIVGYDGLTFVDNLQPRNRLELSGDGVRCAVDFAYAPAANGSLPLIGPLRCTPQGAPP